MSERTKSPYRVVLDTARFDEEAAKRGWVTNAQAAEALGIAPSSLHKLRSRKTEPQAVTIDRLVTELDLPYRALFIREERQCPTSD